MLSGPLVTIGDTNFDVRLLQNSGIEKNLYRVDDLTSDAVVLQLCTSETKCLVVTMEKIVLQQLQLQCHFAFYACFWWCAAFPTSLSSK